MFQRMCKCARDDILLRQEDMLLHMRKERIFHCAKRRCNFACPKRGYFVASRDVSAWVQERKLHCAGDFSEHMQEGIFHCAEVRCFSACAKRGLRQEEMFLLMRKERIYFIAPRGDVSAHAQREDISLPRDVSAHAQREDI